MISVILALVLPALFWEQGPETAPTLREAGVNCVHVPAAGAAAWEKAGFCHVGVSPATLEGFQKALTPGVRMIANEASATRSPWITANGWRFERAKDKRGYLYEAKAGTAALAAAEAFAYDAEALIRIEPADLKEFGRMLGFLKRVDKPPLPSLADVGVVDDDSALVGEVMNLFLRRNVLFRASRAPDPSYPINIQLGVNYPKSEAANPGAFALKIRRQLTDEKRLLQIFGSAVVIGRFTSDGKTARLHLLNYGKRPVEGLRVRMRGSYGKPALLVAGQESSAAEDYMVADGGTEFSIPVMGAYSVVDFAVVQ